MSGNTARTISLALKSFNDFSSRTKGSREYNEERFTRFLEYKIKEVV
jgi:hypothetical protein